MRNPGCALDARAESRLGQEVVHDGLRQDGATNVALADEHQPQSLRGKHRRGSHTLLWRWDGGTVSSTSTSAFQGTDRKLGCTTVRLTSMKGVASSAACANGLMRRRPRRDVAASESRPRLEPPSDLPVDRAAVAKASKGSPSTRARQSIANDDHLIHVLESCQTQSLLSFYAVTSSHANGE